MKKLILLTIILLVCSTFVLASYTEVVPAKPGSEDYKVTYQQTIKKGWNLLPSWNKLPGEGGSWTLIADKSTETEIMQKVKGYYLYLPLQQKYISALGGFDNQDFNLLESNHKYLQSPAAWYYVKDDLVLSYGVAHGGMPSLYKGWNLLSISPSLSVLNPDVKANNHFPFGDCQFEKFYTWDSQSQKWSEKNMGMSNVESALDELADSDAIGIGIAVKVKNSCQLGVESKTMSTLPALPN